MDIQLPSYQAEVNIQNDQIFPAREVRLKNIYKLMKSKEEKKMYIFPHFGSSWNEHFDAIR